MTLDLNRYFMIMRISEFQFNLDFTLYFHEFKMYRSPESKS